MSQHDLTIDNQGFPAFRADLNSALQALGSCQSGTSAPATTFANQLWYDTTNNILKIRNEDNDAWISLLTLDQTNDVLSAISLNTINEGTSGSGITIDGVLLKDNSVTATADSLISGLTVGKGGGSVAGNTAVGQGSLQGSNSGSGYNTAVGYNTMYSNTSGAYNTAVGNYNTMYANTTGSSNIAIGGGDAVANSALRFNTTGSYNSAVGIGALGNNTTASNNTAVGYQAGYSNTTGTQNTIMGFQAGYTNSTANGNNFFGQYAGYYATGANNTAIGNAAFANASAGATGANNVALGNSALYSNTTASNNTAVGYQAGYSTTTSGGNVFVGHQAGYTNTTGSYNTAVGQGAGFGITTGVNNTYLGQGAGYGTTTGSYNTFVGPRASTNYGAGELVTTGSKNTIIGGYNGNQGGLDIRTSSNYIVLSDGDGNPRAYWDNNGIQYTTANANGNTAMYLNNSGNSTPFGVFISFTAASPNNTTQYFITGSDSTQEKFKIYSNGNMVNRNNSYGTLSDAKLKENIVDTTPKLDKLMQVQVRNFNMIGDDLKQIGFVAQELEAVFPSLVVDTPDTETTEDGVKELGTTTKEVKTTVLIPILVKAIQELKAEVDSLKQQLASK